MMEMFGIKYLRKVTGKQIITNASNVVHTKCLL